MKTLEYLQFSHLTDTAQVTHASLLRHGGTSQGPYASLNVTTAFGDSPDCINENLKRIQTTLGIPRLRWANQVHATQIIEVTTKEGTGCAGTGDALITAIPGVALMVKHADCQGLVIYDPVCRIIAALHAGWRGNVQNIHRELIVRLKAMGSHPANLLVGISPSLGPCHAEFIHYRKEFPENLWEFQVKPHYFDLWAMTEKQLIDCGVLPHHIENSKMCTFAHAEQCFSYRRDKVTGRHGTLIMMN